VADGTIYVAKESFTTILDGEAIVVQAGTTRVRAGHKLLKGRQMLFEPLLIHYDVEQATAAPAEVRKASPYKVRPEVKPEPAPEPAPEAPESPDLG
jgi:hypothetical protein